MTATALGTTALALTLQRLRGRVRQGTMHDTFVHFLRNAPASCVCSGRTLHVDATQIQRQGNMTTRRVEGEACIIRGKL